MNKQMRPEQVRAVQEQRRSGASGTHGDRRLRRQRTRQQAKRQALRDW